MHKPYMIGRQDLLSRPCRCGHAKSEHERLLKDCQHPECQCPEYEQEVEAWT